MIGKAKRADVVAEAKTACVVIVAEAKTAARVGIVASGTVEPRTRMCAIVAPS